MIEVAQQLPKLLCRESGSARTLIDELETEEEEDLRADFEPRFLEPLLDVARFFFSLPSYLVHNAKTQA